MHAPGTTAHPEAEGFDASPGLTVRIGVKARENVRISRPWGNCTDETAKIKKYTLLSCQNECIQKRIMEKCECVDNRLPHSNASRLPFCYQLPSEWLNRPHCSNVTIDEKMTIEEDCQKITNSWYNRLQCVTDVYHNMTIKVCSKLKKKFGKKKPLHNENSFRNEPFIFISFNSILKSFPKQLCKF